MGVFWRTLAQALAVLALGACESEGSEPGSQASLDAADTGDAADAGIANVDTSTSVGTCSIGPAYNADAQFAQGTWEDAGVRCTPHCGSEQPQRWAGTGLLVYTVDALPSGACAPRSAPCNMDVGRPCNQDPVAIWHSFACKCVDGNWSCDGSYKGGGACASQDGS